MNANPLQAVRPISPLPAPAPVLPGDYLFVAGSDLCNRLNQPSQHLPYHLAPHVERLDVVGYACFYDGPRDVPARQRLAEGLRNLASKRVAIRQDANVRTVTLRRLRLPGALDPLLQDLWLYAVMRGQLKPRYVAAVVDGPESALVALFLKRTGRVGTLVYYDIDYYPAVRPQWAGILARREQLLCRVADASASVSRPLAVLREQQGARLAAVIPNGVEFDQFHAAAGPRDRVNGRAPTLIYTGSLDARWGVDLPLRAMPFLRRQMPGVRLLIAGRGPAEDDLRALARDLELDGCVEFAGFVPYPELPKLLAQADIGVATSRANAFRRFASPLKIVEYMAAGLPVICSGGGEAEQMVTESCAGVNIPFEPEAFAAAVRRMWETPGALAAGRESAVAYARSRSWDEMGASLARLLAGLSVQSAPAVQR